LATLAVAVAGLHAEKAKETEHATEESGVKAVELDSAMESMVGRLLNRHGKHPPSQSEMVDAGLRKMNVDAAARRLESKLPQDMASLVQSSLKEESHQPFAEDSLAKALKYLNMLTVKAWKELDDKLIECKEFEDKNRGSFKQVSTQIATLSEYISDLSAMKAQATEMINVKEQEIIATTAMLKKETDIYMKIFLENKMEMTIRRNDLAVFSFMLKLVKCKKAAAFAQLDEQPGAQVCENAGTLELHFDDKKLEAEVESKMTPSARGAINEFLAQMNAAETKKATALLQIDKGDYDYEDDGDLDADDSSDNAQVNEEADRATALSSLGVRTKERSIAEVGAPAPAVTTTAGMPTPLAKKVKVQKEVVGGRFACKGGPVDCGLLHDNFSLMWGKFKDLVDELQAEMDKNEFHFMEFKENINAQLDVMRSAKAKYILELNEAIANIASAQEELAGEQEEYTRLEKEYKHGMKLCRKKIEWIMFQDICAFLKVRAKVMKYSKVSPPEKIVDCGLSAWVPGECSVPCDDKCPDKRDPYKCGGIQTLTRTIVVMNNAFGYSCALLARKRKCNQVKCPVDCRQSRWSSWSKCTKDCEGGSRSRTRSILVQPKNGGMACNTAAESQPCNTGSCDRNCRLRKWTKWSPCSVACAGGFSERWRRVIIPIRGNGRCPKPKSRIRYGLKKCNTHKCKGDEVCIAKQDLILSIDSSGSLREEGFKILRTFAYVLVDKYKGEYYGYTDMQIGIVQFGNGEILKDGTVAGAKDILPLTSDIAKVKKAVQGLAHMKGFTNMAQAFTVAQKLLLLGGRKAAQSAVMTLTDGKPSFVFQTNEQVLQLKDKHTKLFFVPVTEFRGKELRLMRKWASRPWRTNLVRVPGLDALSADPVIFAQKCLVMFCPEAMSPSDMLVEESVEGFMLVRENGLCGKRGPLLSRKVTGAEECAALAMGAKLSAFSLGIRYARGRCYGQLVDITADMIQGFSKDRANPKCPDGKWRKARLYDFYAIIPAKPV